MALPTNRVLTELNAAPTIRGVLEDEGLLVGDEAAAAASASAAQEAALRAQQYRDLTEQIRASAEAEAAERARQFNELVGQAEAAADRAAIDTAEAIKTARIDCGTPTG